MRARLKKMRHTPTPRRKHSPIRAKRQKVSPGGLGPGVSDSRIRLLLIGFVMALSVLGVVNWLHNGDVKSFGVFSAPLLEMIHYYFSK
jgi:hypothetical protein